MSLKRSFTGNSDFTTQQDFTQFSQDMSSSSSVKYSKKANSFSGKNLKWGQKKSKRTGYKKFPVYASVKAIAKQQIISLSEKRNASTQNTCALGNVVVAGWQNIGVGIIPLSPYTGFLDIAQGAQQSNRTANSIRTHSGTLSYVIRPTPYNATTNPSPIPQYIKMWFVKFKGQSNVTASLASFFQLGNTSTNFTGTLIDLNGLVNSDVVTLMGTREMKLGYAQANAAGAAGTYQYFSNNDYNLSCHGVVDYTKWLSKTYKFNDNTGNIPFNDPLFVVVSAMNADGSPYSANNIMPGYFDYNLEYKYTDF